MTKTKYLYKRKTKSGHFWFFDPPQDAIDAGVVSRQTFKDGRTARHVVAPLVERVALFRKGELAGYNLSSKSTFGQVAANYFNTAQFDKLANNTKSNYRQTAKAINETKYGAKLLRDFRLDKFNARICAEIYNGWCNEHSVYTANYRKAIFSVIMSHAMSLDVIHYNPMSNIKTATHKSEQVLWTKDQVDTFLDTAFSKFETRNLGLIVAMAYDWCQRPIDIRHLKWDSVNLEEQWVKIKQQKRGTTVELPISDSLKDMLEQQLEDFGHQPYVAPYFRIHDAAWRPYTRDKFSRDFTKVREEAGLPKELTAAKLRPTGINEMVEKNVDVATMRSVTGHKNLQSLNPYVKNTLASAKAALKKRNQDDDKT